METVESTKTEKPKRVTASSTFQKLIMENVDKTDLEIFREVQSQFGADKIPDRHANYVGWYRGYLRKNGKNPPAAVKAARVTKPAKNVGETEKVTVANNVSPIKSAKKSKKK